MKKDNSKIGMMYQTAIQAFCLWKAVCFKILFFCEKFFI
jgi:hypothetical protein